MLETLLASLSTLLPQQPTPTAPAAEPTATATTAATTDRNGGAKSPAWWLPDTTLAAIVLEPLQPGTDVAQLLGSDDGRGMLGAVSALLQPALQQAHLTNDDVAAMLRGGAALGLLGYDRKMVPDMVLVAGIGDAEIALAAHAAKLPQRSDGLRTIDGGPAPLYLALQQGHVAVGTVAASVQRAIDQTRLGSDLSLAERRDYQQTLPAAGTRLAHLFVRIADLTGAALDNLPVDQAAIVRRIADVLGLADMGFLSGSWRLEGDDLVSQWQLDAPHAKGSLLDALAGTAGRLDASLARFVPRDATGCGFFTVRFGTVFDELMALASMVNPAIGTMVDQRLERLRDQTGVDVRADLIGGLGERLVLLNLPGETDQFGLLVELRAGGSFARGIGKLVPLLPVPLEQGTTAGARCWRMPGGDGGPAFAVTDDWLMLGSSDEALATAARQVREPKADAEVLAFLRSLPPDTTAATRGQLSSSLPGPWFAQATASLPADLGMRTALVRRTDDGYIAEERAAARAVLQVATAVARSVSGAPALAGGGAPTGGDGHDDPDAAATLRALANEKTSRLNVTTLAAMLSHRDAKIVARACWQLGEWQAKDAVPMLSDLARSHDDADVRLQAIAAIARIGGPTGAEALALATEDDDQRVRMCAVQGLGRLGGAYAATPLLSMLDRYGSQKPDRTAPQDVVAALVVLHDLGDASLLVRAATAIGFSSPSTGQALAFLFQGLSPRLPEAEESKALLAVLDHPEPMLRRYAVQRLGELRDPSTAKALESRLAVEGSDLQPLVRVSLAQVRGDTEATDDDLVSRAKSNVTAISQMVERRWSRLGTTTKVASASAVGALLLGLIGFLMARRRSRRRADAAAARAMVGPSAGYAASGRHDEAEYYDEADDAFAEVGSHDGDRNY